MLMYEEKRNTILIADDGNENMDAQGNIDTLKSILEDEYNLYSVYSGLDAIGKAIQYRPDLILLNAQMPDMEKYKTLEKLKNTENTCNIPVILLVEPNNKNDEMGITLGAADYIEKPFNPCIVKLRVKHQIQIVNQLNTIKHLTLIDPLTNLPNRRCFDERLRMEWGKAIREKTSISLLMLDLDNFKALNEKYSHQQGDIALQAVSGIFPLAFRRPGDYAARWGGEEFAVILPNTPMEGAADIAEKIRSDIEKLEIPSIDGSNINVTVCIGVNSAIPMKGNIVDSFISGADKALNAAKSSGRNKIAAFNN